MVRFLVVSACTTIIIIVLSYAGSGAGLFPFPSFLWLIEGVLLATTAAIFRFLLNRPPGLAFTQVYLFSIVTKICFFGVLMALVIIFDKAGASGNVVVFMVSYVVLTVVEITFLFRKINRSQVSQKIK